MDTTNTEDQIEQTTGNKIKFTPAEGGVINSQCGQTIFSDLFMFGAFALTRKLKRSGEAIYDEYQTDREGLEALEMKTGDTIDLISDSIAMLGAMIANVDKDNMSSAHIDSYGWLVCGLGELLGQLSRENSNISCLLRHQAKAT